MALVFVGTVADFSYSAQWKFTDRAGQILTSNLGSTWGFSGVLAMPLKQTLQL